MTIEELHRELVKADHSALDDNAYAGAGARPRPGPLRASPWEPRLEPSRAGRLSLGAPQPSRPGVPRQVRQGLPYDWGAHRGPRH